MAASYALLLADETLIFANRKGGEWVAADSPTDAGPRGRNLTVFIDGRDVLGLRVNLPARNEKEARKAAPFAVEDDIAEAAEAVHVALSEPASSDPSLRTINVVSQDMMTSLTGKISDIGYPEADIVSAHSLMPEGDCLVAAADVLLGAIGRRSFALDEAIGTDVLRGLVETSLDIKIYGNQLADALGRPAAGSALPNHDDLLIWLAEQSEQGLGGISLRQGQYQSKRPVDLKGIKQWRLVGALAAVIGIGWFANTVLETQAMNARTAELDRLSAEFAQAGWPDTNGDVQRALTLSGAVQGGSNAGLPSALTTVSILYDSLGTVPGAELRSLRFDMARGQLSAVIAFDGFADVDQLASAVQSRGLAATAGDSRQSGGKVVGDLTIGAGT